MEINSSEVDTRSGSCTEGGEHAIILPVIPHFPDVSLSPFHHFAAPANLSICTFAKIFLLLFPEIKCFAFAFSPSMEQKLRLNPIKHEIHSISCESESGEESISFRPVNDMSMRQIR